LGIFYEDFGIFYAQLVHFVLIRYILSGFGIMYQEKSGNPVLHPSDQWWKVQIRSETFLIVIAHLRCKWRNWRSAIIEILDLEQVYWHRSCKHFGWKNPCKKSADLHPRQGILLHFYRAQQNLSLLHKIGWRQAEQKFARFFNMRLLDLRFLCLQHDSQIIGSPPFTTSGWKKLV
jgi:hypothetical protein